MKKESFKSILLILLFIVSLTLMERLWFYLPFSQVISLENDVKLEEINIDVTDILSPQSFIVSFGGGDNTVFFSEPYEIWNWNITEPEEKKDVWIWETSKAVLKNYLNKDYDIQEIAEEEWKKIKKFKSIELNFACEIPSESLIKALSDDTNHMFKIKDEINTILIPVPEEEKTNVYIGNYKENKYFKLTGSPMGNEMRELIENIEKIVDDKGYMYYTPLKDIFSKVDNDVLAPIFDEEFIPIPSYSSRNQIDTSDSTFIKSRAHQFFGVSFDFVKEIKEMDGTYIYMYGYGEKVLKISKDGVLEYTEKAEKKNGSINLSFLDSLKYAAKFVDDKSDWPVNKKNSYLSDYEIVERDNMRGYLFSFNYTLNGLPVFIPDNAQYKAFIPDNNQYSAIKVEVIGNQVTYYKRIVKRAGQKFNNEEKSIPSINTVWEKYYTMIKDNYGRENKLEEDVTEDFKISEIIEDIRLVYYLHMGRLVPAWEITIDNIVYYFDLYTGENYTSFPIKKN